ncbi:GNAT family N-acetyltransferase [Legionella waltersii]|uniref:N-acetyltransferase domain-containing protein n=1 Tax=Legionella waltersii TaxID=66969 RepID=A0A0W1A5U8_9GAMM|nr:GNAT family N-acetyltransferase [Legionella waltersii]KTD76616.1 hypothetical protein Lwal_2338 [Legionella waltersii]SNU94645.1 N-terminal acetyltransferase, GNAT family [Legionella waltersii]
MIKQINQINDYQTKELEALVDACKKNDGSVPNVYPHILKQERAVPACLLYYKNNSLVGFLSVYFFYEDAVEISVLVHPKHRKKGIAKKMLQQIEPLLVTQGYYNLLFCNPAGVNDKWLKKRGFVFIHSEYFMERDDLNPLLNQNQSLTFRLATPEDIPILCALDEVCFPDKSQNLVSRFEQIMSERDYEIILAIADNHPIGKSHIRWQPKCATLSDIAVLPKEQGKGLGTALIAYCINIALSEGKTVVNLDVETHNTKALDLYVRLGFHVSNACDYWLIRLNDLPK